MRIQFLIILMLPMLFQLTGCISTSAKGFTDPDYLGFTAHKLLVEAPNSFFDDSFINKTKNIDVSYHSANSLFLPTRTYTVDEKASIIKEQNFDAYLFIGVTGDDQSSRVTSYQTNSYANAYSTGYGSAYASGSSTTVPITAHKRRTTAKATLYDVKTGRAVWVADLKTSASGSLYMSNSKTVNSMVIKIISELIKNGHLQKKTTPKL